MRTLFVGDVHGCAAEFSALLAALDCQPGRDSLLLTGDAFSRGPDPLGVWKQIQAHRAAMVMGNHEARLLRQLQALHSGQSARAKWPDQQYTLDQLAPVAGEVFSWLVNLPLYIETAAYVLVHAGIHPERGLAGTSRDEFLAIRTWPPGKGIAGPRWHDFLPPGEKLLVFGHDAPGGLVLKRRPEGQPYLLGLDSGCIYGGKLSGYVLEEDRLVQVPSQQDGSRWLADNAP